MATGPPSNTKKGITQKELVLLESACQRTVDLLQR